MRAQKALLWIAFAHAGCATDSAAHTPADAAGATGDVDTAANAAGRDAGAGSPGATPLDAGLRSFSDAMVVVNTASDAGPSGPGSFAGEGTPWLQSAPRATCSEGDMPDGKLGGLNGDFRCNLTVAGQVDAPHFLSLAWQDDCAYVNGSDGTTVIQVSPAGAPTVLSTLTEVGFRSNWESMKANPESRLLAGYESNGATLTVYDLSADCKAPVLQSSTQLGDLGSIGHAGSFSPDGTIYYASSMYTSSIYAVDLAMPKAPVVITSTFDRSAHDLYIGKNGTRGYFAYPTLTTFNVGSLAIMDLTDVQKRVPNATGKLIKELQWEDGNISQYPVPVHYGGQDFLIITDELGSGNCDDPKKPQWGYARIFDIRDETNPKLVSLIRTEAQDPQNCKAAGDANGGDTSGFGFGVHYCNVDRLDDPRVLACANWDAGLRVYDIRNPWQPKEVAYFDTPTGNMPGLARILPDKREIWIAMQPSTFFVLKITPGTALDRILAE